MGSYRLKSFKLDGQSFNVLYVRTDQVTAEVECDIYALVGDDGRDLGVVRVRAGHRTPLQRVVGGEKTIERYIAGTGTLTVVGVDQRVTEHRFPSDQPQDVIVAIGETMQWTADKNSDLTFYEICEPPYQDGRFIDLA